MGWASGGYIFDDVASACIEAGIRGTQLRIVASALISSLQAGDWDTEGESLGEFSEYPEIVAAFKEHGVILECWDESELIINDKTYPIDCELEIGHDGPHRHYLWQSNSYAEWNNG